MWTGPAVRRPSNRDRSSACVATVVARGAGRAPRQTTAVVGEHGVPVGEVLRERLGPRGITVAAGDQHEGRARTRARTTGAARQGLQGLIPWIHTACLHAGRGGGCRPTAKLTTNAARPPTFGPDGPSLAVWRRPPVAI